MKEASVEIKITALVNGKEVECELSKDSRVIITGDLIINNVSLDPK